MRRPSARSMPIANGSGRSGWRAKRKPMPTRDQSRNRRNINRHDSLPGRRKILRRQRRAMVVDGRRPREPYLVPLRMIGDMLQGFAQHTEPVGLSDDHGVQGDAADQRLLGRLPQQLLELTDDEIAELLRRMMPH